jgi:hypothetical protein
MTDSPTDQPDRASAAPAVDLFTPAASGSPEREARVRAAFLRAVIGDMPGPSADTR